MSNMLCIDWDFFFFNPIEAHDLEDHNLSLWDWGHSEHLAFLADALWVTRAAGFYAADVPLPQITPPTEGWGGFWSRFTLAENAWMGVADSNTFAGDILPEDGSDAFEHIVLFDAHHDSGYAIDTLDQYEAQTAFTCEDWMLEHQVRGTTSLTVRYPTWKPHGPQEDLPAGALTRQVVDDGHSLTGIAFDTVFVCRSGTWVPPWCDQDFLAFLNAAPITADQIDSAPLMRDFNAPAAEVFGASLRETFAPSSRDA